MRVVVDTNIIVRAVIKPQGSVGPVLQRLRLREYTLLISRPTLDELVEVLHRPRLRVKYQLSDSALRATIRLIVARSELIRPSVQISACRDPKDDKFIEVAVTGKADVIVSGDDDLLTLAPYAGIPIVLPNQFLTMLDMSIS